MLRSDYGRYLAELQTGLSEMGERVESATQLALKALETQDVELARSVIEADDAIDELQDSLESQCVVLLATQQPAASDLRSVLCAVHIAAELERMGDYAEGIAKICIRIGDQPLVKPLIDIPRMAELALKMLHDSLRAYMDRDESLAVQVCAADDTIDDLYNQIYRELLSYMLSDPRTIERATYLLWVAHNLERIADRATNIGERVMWLITGHTTGNLPENRSLR